MLPRNCYKTTARVFNKTTILKASSSDHNLCVFLD